ncbi:MAG: alpha-mannosidase [Promethearchaeia archaeon]
MVKANLLVLVSETHWDREWYLSFQEYRARLVILIDKLLDLLQSKPEFRNFTLDGQTIVLEDYLEVKPDKKEILKNFIKQGRISVGPMYILPDEFLISGESLIRNLMFGHQIAAKFGRVMKAGYIPDPFGHIAQLPQILSGFEIPSVLFARGFGDEFDKNELNVEFLWQAPSNAASILGIHLIEGYGSVAALDTRIKDGKYHYALRKIKRVVSKMEHRTATPIIVLNNGSDHLEAQPEIPEIIKQWNEANPDKPIEHADFEYYIQKLLECKPNLKLFCGELRGGKYQNLLSGVLSARMWIKQRNTSIENLYEKYTEPISLISWAITKNFKPILDYPAEYIKVGYKWLIKNHPHDSICGCSIDQVHEEMKTRFDWAEQIGNEIFKDGILRISKFLRIPKEFQNDIPLIVYNPLPWPRRDIVFFNVGTLPKKDAHECLEPIRIVDINNNEIITQSVKIPPIPRYKQVFMDSYRFSFIADVPPLGYKLYFLKLEEPKFTANNAEKEFKINDNSIENEHYKLEISEKGIISLLDKKSGKIFEKFCEIEDVGDWGDEYDYSGPNKNAEDLKILSENEKYFRDIKTERYLDGLTHKTLLLSANLHLPKSLNDSRTLRSEDLVDNPIKIYFSLYKGINRLDIKIEFENNSKDHRIRLLFPSLIKSKHVYADGHFYVVKRDVEIPKVLKWKQLPLPTNHQKDFISISDENSCFIILNRGLPEYEAIKNNDGTITLAITLLRCIEWLSRGDLATRKGNAGPDLNTPGAQCLGTHTFDLSVVIENGNGNWYQAYAHIFGKEFNAPLKCLVPQMIESQMRIADSISLTPYAKNFFLLNDSFKSIKNPFLPTKFSFLEIDNNAVLLSALKKSEHDDDMILRCYNISSESQVANLNFTEKIKIKNAKLVNFLEKDTRNPIKAKLTKIEDNKITIELMPHVIVTIKINFD